MSEFVDKMIEELIGREGRYSNHPSDTGGETMWGITERVARKWGYKGPMRALPREVAKEIYYSEYFIDPGFNQVAKISTRVANELFDTGVNMGPRVAIRFFQEALNGLNMQQKLYADIAEDMDIGPATIGAFKKYMQKRPGAEGILVMIKALDCLQGAHYLTLGRKRQKNEDFMYGWLAHRIGQA